MAGDVAGGVGAEEAHHACHFFGLAEAAEGDGCELFGAAGFGGVGNQGGFNEPRCHGVDGDAAGGKLACGGAGESEKPGLGGAVGSAHQVTEQRGIG